LNFVKVLLRLYRPHLRKAKCFPVILFELVCFICTSLVMNLVCSFRWQIIISHSFSFALKKIISLQFPRIASFPFHSFWFFIQKKKNSHSRKIPHFSFASFLFLLILEIVSLYSTLCYSFSPLPLPSFTCLLPRRTGLKSPII